MKRRLLRLFAAALLAALLLTACSTEAEPPVLLEPAVVQTDTAIAQVRELTDINCYEGIVEPEIVPLSFSSGGIIDELYVGIGSSVKKGDVLARLDTKAAQVMADSLINTIDYSKKSNELINRQSECDIEIAEIQLEKLTAEEADGTMIQLKRVELENLRNSYSALVAQQQLSLEKSEKQLSELQETIDNSVITAPCDGTVLFSTATEGGWAMAYSTVIWMADDSSSYIKCDFIRPDDIDKAYEIYALLGGHRADITYMPYDRAAYMSQLASGSTVESTFSIDQAEALVETGMLAYVMLIKDHVPAALTVPANAVLRDGNDHYVYLVSAGGAQTKQAVKTGLSTDAYIQITQGLEEGELVYVGN